MCTNIAQDVVIAGSAKRSSGWLPVNRVYVGYDHPVGALFEHALSLDFINESEGMRSRFAVELSRESARELASSMLEVLRQADAYESASHLVGE